RTSALTPCLARSSVATSCSRGSVRATSTTSYPSLASLRANARPIPAVAPVTSDVGMVSKLLLAVTSGRQLGGSVRGGGIVVEWVDHVRDLTQAAQQPLQPGRVGVHRSRGEHPAVLDPGDHHVRPDLFGRVD